MREASILFEGSAKWGYGHYRRCRTLASALASEGFHTTLYVAGDIELDSPGFNWERFDSNANDFAFMEDRLVVVDGYHFSKGVLEAANALSDCFLRIDDLGDQPLTCDVLINQNIYASRLDYSTYEYAYGLYGPRFALIDPFFRGLRNTNRDPRVVTISLGGGATALLGLELVTPIAEAGAREIHIALGSNSIPRSIPRRIGNCEISYYTNADMKDLYGRSGVVIGALGTSLLEVLASGTAYIGIKVAENQSLNFLELQRLGQPVHYANDISAIVHSYRRIVDSQQEEREFEFPDNFGADRVARVLASIMAD